MKGIFTALVLACHLLQAQNNVALLHLENTPTHSKEYSGKSFSVAPFDLAGGIVIVQASLEGRTGNFILDTGAPGIVLNQEKGTEKVEQKAAGIGGALSVQEVVLKNFEWGIIHKKRLNGFALNVSHLEKACGRNIMGLIGFDVLRNYELYFDFKNKIIKIFSTKEADLQRVGRQVKSIPFVLHGHVPVVTAKIGGKTALLGLDSGAEVNLLDEQFFPQLREKYLTNIEEERVTGLSNSTQTVLAADVLSTLLKGQDFPNMRYLFSDMTCFQKQFGAPLDGVLGFPFFKNSVISINYKTNRIYIWE